jgi:hypothetical protein
VYLGPILDMGSNRGWYQPTARRRELYTLNDAREISDDGAALMGEQDHGRGGR